MTIILFAIIGSTIDAGAGYWVCFGVYAAAKIAIALVKMIKEAE